MLCSDNYAYVDVIISQLDQSACIIAHNAHIAVNYRRSEEKASIRRDYPLEFSVLNNLRENSMQSLEHSGG